VQDAKPAQDAQENAEDAKPAKPAHDVKPTDDDAEDAKPAQENGEDAKPTVDDAEDAKPAHENGEDAKPTEDDAEDAKPADDNKKRKNSNKISAVEKKGQENHAWLIDGACVSKEDITCFELEMSDPFHQLKNSYFAPNTTLQTVVIDYKQKGQKKKNMTLCFVEQGMYSCKQNVVMGDICREIWPDPESNPFSHGAFGSCVLYHSGLVSGAPCSDMPPVAAIDDFIERLCESNE